MAESPIPIAEIDHGPSKLDQFLDQHTTKLVAAAIILALAIVGYVIYSSLAQAKEEEAGAALSSAESSADYQDVIKQWPESKSAASAMLLLAGTQKNESQAEATQTLTDFIAKYPEHPATPTAKVSLGLTILEQGKTDEAITLLTEVTDDDNASYIAPLALITLGDIAKSTGDISTAKSWYEKALEDSTAQGNTYADTAKARLALVNAKAPTKIQPTPPAPAVPSEAALPSGTPGLPQPNIPQPPVTPPASSKSPSNGDKS